MLSYLHPITAGLALALLAYAGMLGLRARNDRRRASELLAAHRRWAPPAFWAVMLSWPLGLVTTWGLRPDLELGTSAHFQIGVGLAATLSASWLSARARWMRDPRVRAAHPWFGIAALLLAAAQIFFGLQITP